LVRKVQLPPSTNSAPEAAEEAKASRNGTAAPTPIDKIDRTDVLCVIRKVFSSGGARDRETALRDVAQALGYQRLGTHVRTSASTTSDNWKIPSLPSRTFPTNWQVFWMANSG
jgi:hypothetical protein